MSGRVSYLVAVILLILAAVLRLHHIATVPTGLNNEEIIDIRITETARDGGIEVFYDLGGEGREGLYYFVLVFVTTLIGNGPFGFRLLSVWTGLLAIAMTYALGRRLFGQLAGLGAMALMTVTLWPNLLSRQITPEALLPLFVVYILVCLASVLPVYWRRHRRGDNTSTAAAMGALLGFVLYVHPVGLLIVLFSMIFILYMLLSNTHISKRRLGYINFAVLLMIIISMPYVISSIRVPSLAGVERITSQESPGISFQRILDSLVGLFANGDSNPLYNLPGRAMFDPITALLIFIGLAVAIKNWRQPRFRLLLIALVILSPVFLLATYAPDFSNFTAAMPLLAILFGLGITALARRCPPSMMLVGEIGLVLLLGFNVSWVWSDMFDQWPENAAVETAFHARLGTLSRYLDRTSRDIPTVLCGWQVNQTPSSIALTDAQMIRLMSNRKDESIRLVDCSNALVMPNGGEPMQIITPDPGVMELAHPAIKQWLSMSQPMNNALDNTVWSLDVEQPLADRIGRLTVDAPVSYAPEVGGSRDQLINTPVTFGGNLTFLGYVPEQDADYHPGSIVTVVTYWRIDGMVPPDLRLFTHILSDPGAIPLANTDIINVNARRLRNRDVLVQVTYIPLPENLPAGDYSVSIGAYQDTSGLRLDVLENGEPHGTRLFLYSITVTA